MITKTEVDNILKDVNRVLLGYDERIKKLEESAKAINTTSKAKSQEKT